MSVLIVLSYLYKRWGSAEALGKPLYTGRVWYRVSITVALNIASTLSLDIEQVQHILDKNRTIKIEPSTCFPPLHPLASVLPLRHFHADAVCLLVIWMQISKGKKRLHLQQISKINNRIDDCFARLPVSYRLCFQFIGTVSITFEPHRYRIGYFFRVLYRYRIHRYPPLLILIVTHD